MTTQLARKYASGTTVSVDKTVAEIQRLVKAHGATRWNYQEWDDTTPRAAMIRFVLGGMPLRMSVAEPERSEHETSPAGRYRTEAQIDAAVEAEHRRCWRELFLLIKAKLVAIQSGVVTMQDEWLSYVLLETEETVGEYVGPRLVELQHRGAMELLPPVIREEDV